VKSSTFLFRGFCHIPPWAVLPFFFPLFRGGLFPFRTVCLSPGFPDCHFRPLKNGFDSHRCRLPVLACHLANSMPRPGFPFARLRIGQIPSTLQAEQPYTARSPSLLTLSPKDLNPPFGTHENLLSYRSLISFLNFLLSLPRSSCPVLSCSFSPMFFP